MTLLEEKKETYHTLVEKAMVLKSGKPGLEARNKDQEPRFARTVDERLKQVSRWTDATKKFHETGL